MNRAEHFRRRLEARIAEGKIVPPKQLRRRRTPAKQLPPRRNHAAPSRAIPSTWAVGVVTAPRKKPTLDRTLTSIRAAGWPDPWVFADGVPVPAGYRGTVRAEPTGGFPNWLLGLGELVLRFPDARYYLMLQDDLLLDSDLRQRLESEALPDGILSPYTSSKYRGEGWFRVDAGAGLLQAQSFLIPNEIAWRILADPAIVNYRRRPPFPAGKRRLDGVSHYDSVIGWWAQQHGIPIWMHGPSLIEHIGETSVMWPRVPLTGQRVAARQLPCSPRAPREGSELKPVDYRLPRPLHQAVGASTHRSGWPYAIQHLAAHATQSGMLLEDFVEQRFVYPRSPKPISEPWIGIFHHAATSPPWGGSSTPAQYLATPAMRVSLPHLRAAIALSEGLAQDLRQRLTCPVHVLRLPTDPAVPQWSPKWSLWICRSTQRSTDCPTCAGPRRTSIASPAHYATPPPHRSRATMAPCSDGMRRSLTSPISWERSGEIQHRRILRVR